MRSPQPPPPRPSPALLPALPIFANHHLRPRSPSTPEPQHNDNPSVAGLGGEEDDTYANDHCGGDTCNNPLAPNASIAQHCRIKPAVHCRPRLCPPSTPPNQDFPSSAAQATPPVARLAPRAQFTDLQHGRPAIPQDQRPMAQEGAGTYAELYQRVLEWLDGVEDGCPPDREETSE